MSTTQGQDDTAVCVLGCRTGGAAISRRAKTAARAFISEGADIVVACGGRVWNGLCEADELARLLAEEGVPLGKIVKERISKDTFGNAAEAARILSDKPVILVTCSWHLPRARLLFERAGLRVVRGIGAEPPHATLLRRTWWRARERVSMWRDLTR